MPIDVPLPLLAGWSQGLGLEPNRLQASARPYLALSKTDKRWAMVLLALSTSLSMLSFISLALLAVGATLFIVQVKMN